MRLKQWYKASIVFAGPLLAGALLSESLSNIILAFFAFGFIASSVYVLNDLKDRDKDKLHPKKKDRPVASGQISTLSALAFGVLLFTLAIYFGGLAGNGVTNLVLGYFSLMMIYTFCLKKRAIIDAFTIATGFVIRAFAGCFAAGIEITAWFYLGVFFFATYLVFCKRFTELQIAGIAHKENLSQYKDVVEIAIAMSGASTIILYTMYAIERGGLFSWSVPLAYLGILLHLKETMVGKEVHESLFTPELIVTFIGFVVLVFLSVYS